jgi:hypothetical protein
MSNSQSRKNSTRPEQKKIVTAGRTVKKAPPPDAGAAPGHAEQVHARAYEIYSRRVAQGVPGNELSDWLQAESEFRREEE